MAVVTTPEGRLWTVNRRWDPDQQIVGGSAGAAIAEVGEPLMFLGIGVVLVVIGMLLVAVEIVTAAVILGAGFYGRTVEKRPWVVEANESGGERRRWHVEGFRASGRYARDVIDALREGRPIPDPPAA
jgi:hypothetical protein